MIDCPKKQCLMSFLCVFAFMMAYDIYVNSVLLGQVFKISAAVLRPAAEMDQLSTWYIAHTAVLAGLFCCLYKDLCMVTGKGTADTEKPDSTYEKSLKFGVKIGLIMGILASRNYTWLPLSMNITMAWFFGALAEGVGIGLILGFLKVKKLGSGSCDTK